jgi:enoyl-CoA hydratase
MTDNILFEKRGGVGHIILNRPEALNALNLDMIEAMHDVLDDCAADDDVYIVLVTSASEKAFCAGGDVKSIALASKAHQDEGGDSDAFEYFFRREYELNTKIHNFEKPYVSIISGICMGGGMGISMHGSHRILTENASFAMPEVKIGFFPDVGGGDILSRMDGGFGLYMGMTGARIKADDMMYLKLGTHFIDINGVDHLVDHLSSLKWARADVTSVLNSNLSNYCEANMEKSGFYSIKEDIKLTFDPDGVESILSRLKDHDADWAKDAYKAISTACPLSIQIAYDHTLNSKGKAFEEIMINEYRLSQYFMHQPEFFEGVRALLIDKDQSPKWSTSFDAMPEDVYQSALSSFEGSDLEI